MHKTSPYIIALWIASVVACGSDTKDTTAAAPATGTASATNPNSSTSGTATASTPAKHSVTIADFAFVPTSLSIATGDSIAFTNNDAATHDMAVQAGEGYTADSNAIVQGATQSMTFTKAGAYELYCTFHPSMTFALTVK